MYLSIKMIDWLDFPATLKVWCTLIKGFSEAVIFISISQKNVKSRDISSIKYVIDRIVVKSSFCFIHNLQWIIYFCNDYYH